MPDMDRPAQERARGKHHGTAGKGAAIFAGNTVHPALLTDQQVACRTFDDVQSFGLRQQVLYGLTIERTVRLRARAMHRWPLGAVQQLEMNPSPISRNPHQAVKRIDFTHKVPLANSANGRIAGHDADGIQAMCQQHRPRAHARGGRCGFAPRMTATHDNHIIYATHSGTSPICQCRTGQTPYPAGLPHPPSPSGAQGRAWPGAFPPRAFPAMPSPVPDRYGVPFPLSRHDAGRG